MSRIRQICFCLLLVLGVNARAADTNSVAWHKNLDRVDADVHSLSLPQLLREITVQTGWRVYVEPGATHNASAKFKSEPSGSALKMLLGDLNFALVPQTNAPSRLYVFTTRLENATRLVQGGKLARHVANELLLRVKPGTDIDALAKMFGAKITGRMDKLGIYRLQFADAAATNAALAQLQNDSDVLDVDYNYYFDPEPDAESIPSASVPQSQSPVSLTLNPPTPGDPCNVIVGLIDTPMQSLGSALNAFLLKSISVVGDSSANNATTAQSFAPILLKPLSTSAAVPTHATSMAQTILRAISQAANGSTSARILPVDVYGTGESTTTWNVALGIQAAVNGGANVLNLSLGSSGDSSVLDSVIQQAIADGILVFAAAGNTPVNTPTYPAAIPGVNAVTALQQPGQIASYANYGSFVDMALPGASIVYLGNQAYVVQGTSVSTAYATGVATGTKSVNCDGWSQIQSAMQQKFIVPQK